MSDLETLAREARSAPTIVAAAPMDALHQRADRRRNRKRLVAAAAGIAVLAVAVSGIAIGAARRTGDAGLGTLGPGEPSGSVTTAPPPPPDGLAASTTLPEPQPSTAEAPTTLVAPPSTVGPTTTPPPASTTTVAPAPVGLDPHGLSTDGLRPLAFGSSVTEAERVTGKTAVPSGVIMCGPGYSEIADALPGVDLHFDTKNTMSYVVVRGNGVTTLSGIGIGTPEATLLDRVPNLVENRDVSTWTVFSPDGKRSVGFILTDGVVSSMVAGIGDHTGPGDAC